MSVALLFLNADQPAFVYWWCASLCSSRRLDIIQHGEREVLHTNVGRVEAPNDAYLELGKNTLLATVETR